jgi:hypothetical protein
MALSDALTAIISAFAAVLALLTFVYTFALKPSLQLQIGREVILHYSTNSEKLLADRRMRLILTADFVFLNKGAQPMVVMELVGILWRSGESRPSDPDLFWRQYEKTENIAPPGKDSQYHTRSSGVVQITTIEGRGISSSRIRLYSPTQKILTEGDYKLDLKAIGGPARRQQAPLSCLLHLGDSDATDLKKNGAEIDKKFGIRISFKRVIAATKADYASIGVRKLLHWHDSSRKDGAVLFVSDPNPRVDR